MLPQPDPSDPVRLLESGQAPPRCYTLRVRSRTLRELPAGLHIDFKLDASECPELTTLPPDLSVPVLVLRGCRSLKALPERLRCDYLDIQDCTSLEHWPDSAQVTIGSVNARNCRSLQRLPRHLGPVTSLNLAGCERLASVPDGVQVHSWIDIGGTGIRGLPDSLERVALRWKGVAVTRQIAFAPETLTAPEILQERNAELRRLMIERVGFEQFLRECRPTVIDRDQDAGGVRELFRVPLEGDEDLVCVSVRCPSTGRHYLIRVPPTMATCHQAVAWTAGFDDPAAYRPVAET